MEEHDYVYRLKPLIVPGIAFLILYPLLMGSIHLLSHLPSIEVIVLIGIYVIAGLGIIALWIIGKSKHVLVKDSQIVFGSLLGEHILDHRDIRRVAFYFDSHGREVAQIRVKDVFYYLNELYFPFPELMSDLESFIRRYDLRSNMEKYAGLNE
jgi:hypothetical protein